MDASGRQGEDRRGGGPSPEVSFDFEKIAWTLAELALNARNGTPFTAVVRGPWGRGKTTLLERTRRWLDDYGDGQSAQGPGYRRVKTLWFNAWKYPDSDTVLAGLLGRLLDSFREGEPADRFKVWVDGEGKEIANSLLRGIVPELLRHCLPDPAGQAVAGPVGQALTGAGRFDVVEQKRAFYDEFERLFRELSYLWFAPSYEAFRNLRTRQLADSEAVVAVFLDDLDRCSTARIHETLEAINLFLDFPGVCFYLGLDWNRLVAALRDRHGDQAERYLEKMFQVALDLPEPSEDRTESYIRTLVGDEDMQELLGDDLQTVAEALQSRDPRHVKRFLNDLSMRQSLLAITGQLAPAVSPTPARAGADAEGKPARVPAPAVLSWHLLRECVEPEEWDSATRNLGNLERLLKKCQEQFANRAAEGGPEADAKLHANQERMVRSSGMQNHVQRLRDLEVGPKSILLHMSAPPPSLPPVSVPPSRTSATAKATLEGADGIGSDLRRLFGPQWWVFLEGGFTMGSEAGDSDERPTRTITLSPYRIAATPVTNAQYEAFLTDMRKHGVKPPSHWEGGRIPPGKEAHPVVNVSWHQAKAFCVWLSGKLAAGTKEAIDLPTEAQWEFAARGPKGREFPWGSNSPTKEHANYGMNVGDTTPVGTYPKGATPEGVLDLAGNVWEWCRDSYEPYRERDTNDPVVETGSPMRVLRGGSFNLDPKYLRAAYRFRLNADYESGLFGFRCVWSAAGGQ